MTFQERITAGARRAWTLRRVYEAAGADRFRRP